MRTGNALIDALIQQESGGNPNAVSPKGARGITQIMPATARSPGYGVAPLRSNDPNEQIRFTRDYMGAMLKKYNGNLELALAAYNAGPGAVDKAGGVPNYPETKNYVKSILSKLNPIGEAQASEVPPAKISTLEKFMKQNKAHYMALSSESPQVKIPTREEFMRQYQAQHQTSADAPPPQVKIPTREEFMKEYQAKNPELSIGERALKNLPRDIKNIGESTIQAVTHPIDTIAGIGAVARGAMQSALPTETVDYLINKGITPESRPQFKAVADSIMQDVKHPIEAFAEHPATTFLNVTGALSGLKGIAKNVAGTTVAKKAAQSIIQARIQNAINAPKAAALENAKAAGFVIPKSEVAPSFINNRLEGIAGKAAINQQAILANQEVATKLSRKAVGIAPDEPITIPALEKIRADHGAVYEKVASLPNTTRGYPSVGANTTSRQDLFNLRQARNDAQGWYDAALRTASPDDLAKAQNAWQTAQQLEAKFERKAINAGQPELVKQLRDSRKEIAKTYTVQKSLNRVTGQVNPTYFGKQIEKGRPLSDGLETIGNTQQAFKKYLKSGELAQTPGVSKVEAMTSLLGGTVGAASFGPGGSMLALVPFVSSPIRNMLLSAPYQKAFVKFAKAEPSKFKMFMNKAVNNKLSPAAATGMLYQYKDNTK